MRLMQLKHIPLVLLVLFSVFLVAASSLAVREDRRFHPGPRRRSRPRMPTPASRIVRRLSRRPRRKSRRGSRRPRRPANGDPGCQAEETAIHALINKEINADKDACIESCNHQQGSATGGQ